MEIEELELFTEMPKVENKAVFTMSTTQSYAFIDTEDSLNNRTIHTAIFGVREDECLSLYTEGNTMAFQSQDSMIRGIQPKLYLSISQFLQKKGYILNKKTCKLIKRNGEEKNRK